MSLRRRIQVLVGVYVVLFAFLTAAIIETIGQRESALAEARTFIEPARNEVNELASGMIERESSLRGYLLTRDDAFLRGYEEGTTRVTAAMQDLDERLSGTDYEAIMRLVLHTSERWEVTVANPELSLAEQGRWDEAASIVGTNTGRRRFAVAQREIGHLRGDLAERQEVLNDATAVARQRLSTLAYVTSLAAIALAIASGWLLRRYLSDPLDTIGAAVDHVVGGALHEPIPITGPPELARLAAHVEQMRATTVGHLDQATLAIEALEQQGPAVALLRDELAPRALPAVESVAIAAATQPAEGAMAGDWFDVSVRGDGVVVIALVDVSGHDPQAGMLALWAKHLLQAAITDRRAPDAALHWVARILGDTGERFLTCVVVEVDAVAGRARYAAAGHLPPLLVDGAGAISEWSPTGPLLGPLPGAWALREVELPAAWTLLLYTDGLVEVRSDAGTFDTADLTAVLHEHAGADPSALVAGCLARARARAAGRFADDVTLIALAPRCREDRTGRPARPARASLSGAVRA